MLVGGEQGGVVEGHILRNLARLPGFPQRLRLKDQLLDLVVHDDQRHGLDDEGAVAAHVGALGGAAADLVDEGAHLVVVFFEQGSGGVRRHGLDLIAIASGGELTAQDLSHHGTAGKKSTVQNSAAHQTNAQKSVIGKFDIICSVADPGSLSRISDPHQRNFNQKNWFVSSRKYDPGCSSRIRIMIF
jgi:hypothetical protein